MCQMEFALNNRGKYKLLITSIFYVFSNLSFADDWQCKEDGANWESIFISANIDVNKIKGKVILHGIDGSEFEALVHKEEDTIIWFFERIKSHPQIFKNSLSIELNGKAIYQEDSRWAKHKKIQSKYKLVCRAIST